MSMKYIRDHYGVPAKRGARVLYSPPNEQARYGTIKISSGAGLIIKLDGNKKSAIYHPTWCIEYLEPLKKKKPKKTGEEHHRAKYPDDLVAKIKAEHIAYIKGRGYTELSRKYGIPHSTVRDWCQRKCRDDAE